MLTSQGNLTPLALIASSLLLVSACDQPTVPPSAPLEAARSTTKPSADAQHSHAETFITVSSQGAPSGANGPDVLCPP